MAAPVIDLNGRWGGKLRDQDIQMVQGDNLTLRVTVRNTDNTLKDLTGGSVLWGFSRRGDLKSSVSGTLSDPTNGVFAVAMPDTSLFSANYCHEAQFTESGGDVGTVLRGTLRIDEDSV